MALTMTSGEREKKKKKRNKVDKVTAFGRLVVVAVNNTLFFEEFI